MMIDLVSDVEVTKSMWLSLDRWFHPESHEHLWGSKLGPLKFREGSKFCG